MPIAFLCNKGYKLLFLAMTMMSMRLSDNILLGNCKNSFHSLFETQISLFSNIIQYNFYTSENKIFLIQNEYEVMMLSTPGRIKI